MSERRAKYHIKEKPQRYFNRETGEHELIPPYNSAERPERPEIFGIRIADGEGWTDNAKAALELLDMGCWVVDPDPRPEVLDLQRNQKRPEPKK